MGSPALKLNNCSYVVVNHLSIRMKKLLIFRRQALFDANDLENYLYDTGATRDDYLDMDPVNAVSGKLKETHWHYSEWDIAGREADKDVDLWHVGWVGEQPFVFDDPYLMKLSAFEKAFRGPKASCIIVVHKDRFTHVTYRIDKELSAILSIVMADLLEHIDNETFHPCIAESLGLTEEFVREERAEPAEG